MTASTQTTLASIIVGGLCWCLSVAPAGAQDVLAPGPESESASEQRWNLHGQATYVLQGHGRIQSPYQSENSLRKDGQSRYTASATAFLGYRPWANGEIYVNPEVFQGFGLGETHGLGGFSNAEAQKGGSNTPQIYIARGFYRHTIGLGGETERVGDDANQLAGTRAINRVTVTVGRFAVNDIFDQNAYAHDGRTQFLNYAIWEGGAFDYAADQKGYGGGLVVEYNEKAWALRGGYLLIPTKSNAANLSWDIPRQGQYIAEYERRYEVMSRPGILRVLGWVANANAGRYRDALLQPEFDPDQSQYDVRKVREQTGFVINLEQSLTDDLGLFARYSWRDARSQVMSWADMDRSTSGGLSYRGTGWGRPLDTIGLGFAVNQLSSDHRAYTAAGGNSVTIGDGQLRYRPEAILETFYSIGLRDKQTVTLDYQYVTNPAYNADRGPVSIFAVRANAQF